MNLLLIMAIIILLYWKVYNFNYIIDDIVRRWDYLYIVPRESPPPNFYQMRPNPWRNFLPVITHMLNVWLLYIMFGTTPALLFAVFPLSVNGAAWKTGGYYSLTTFLALTAYYFIAFNPNVFGALLGATFFAAALGTTIVCLGLPFLFLFVGTKWGLILFWPLIMYLTGERFTQGFKIRNTGKRDRFTWRKPAVMTKVLAHYIYIIIWPTRLAFFKSFGFDYLRKPEEKKIMDSYNKDFWVSLLVVVAFFVAGMLISPLGTMWFFVCLAPFTQFKLLGQFVAERYLYLPSVGYILIISKLCTNPIILMIVATLYVLKTIDYIPAFKNILNLYKHGIKDVPDCSTNYCNLGERYLHSGKLEESRKLFYKSLQMDKSSFLAWVNLAAYYSVTGNNFGSLYCTEMGMVNSNPENSGVMLHNQRVNLMKEILDKHKIGDLDYDIDLNEIAPGMFEGIVHQILATKKGYGALKV